MSKKKKAYHTHLYVRNGEMKKVGKVIDELNRKDEKGGKEER